MLGIPESTDSRNSALSITCTQAPEILGKINLVSADRSLKYLYLFLNLLKSLNEFLKESEDFIMKFIEKRETSLNDNPRKGEHMIMCETLIRKKKSCLRIIVT